MDDLRAGMVHRFQSMEGLLTEKLLRVEQVMDARLRRREEDR